MPCPALFPCYIVTGMPAQLHLESVPPVHTACLEYVSVPPVRTACLQGGLDVSGSVESAIELSHVTLVWE